MGLKEAKERVETALESDNHKLALIKLIRTVYVEGMEASGNSVIQADSRDDYLQQVTSQAAEIDTLWRIVNRLIDRINAT